MRSGSRVNRASSKAEMSIEERSSLIAETEEAKPRGRDLGWRREGDHTTI